MQPLDSNDRVERRSPLAVLRRFWSDVRNPRVTRWLRIVVAVGLLTWLMVSVDWPTVLLHVERMDPFVVALIMVALAVQLAVSSWKWQWALRVLGLRFRYVFLTRVLFIGFFLNNFLPSSIGGDAYRIYRTLPSTPPRSRAVTAVLLERIVGLAALLVLGFLGSLTLHSVSPLARTYVALAVVGSVLALALLMTFRKRLVKWHKEWHPTSPWLGSIQENLRLVASARAEWFPLIGLSLLFQVQAILIVCGLFGALDVSVTPSQAALMTTAAGLAAVIPFSINGLGIVEASIAGTAVAVGVSYEAGLIVALLIRILVIPLTLLAGLVYAFEPVHLREIPPSVPNIRSPG